MPIRENNILTNSEIERIFNNIEEIAAINNEFLNLIKVEFGKRFIRFIIAF